MCGLFGSYGLPGKQAYNILRPLATLSSLRGTDSTGCTFGYKDKNNPEVLEFSTYKSLNNSADMADLLSFQKAFEPNPQVVLGHARKTTTGDTNLYCAQPIETERIIGVHNGTIQHLVPDKWNEYHGVCTKDEVDQKGISDSIVLFRILDQRGLSELMQELENSFDPALAIIYVDRQNNTLNFLRNDKRKLYFAENNKNKGFVWASEAEFINFALDYADEEVKKDWSEVALFPEETLLSINLLTNELTTVEQEIPKQIWKFKPATGIYNHAKHYLPPPHIHNELGKVKVKGPFVGFGGVPISRKKYKELLAASSCSFCGSTDSELGDKVTWVDYKDYVCEDCTKYLGDQLPTFFPRTSATA